MIKARHFPTQDMIISICHQLASPQSIDSYSKNILLGLIDFEVVLHWMAKQQLDLYKVPDNSSQSKLPPTLTLAVII